MTEKLHGKTVTNTEGRIICIGDLHGCHKEARKLMEKCRITDKDTVIFLGDLVDRGPDNDYCVDLAMQHECILGNHEERHIRYRDIEELGGDPNVSVPQHLATREQLRKEHYDYFRSLPHYIRLPQYNAVCVHAGVFPGRSIEEQDEHHMLHIQMIKPIMDRDGLLNTRSKWPSKVPKDEEDQWRFWTHFWDGPERIIFGHSVLNKPLITPKAVGIDGGAVFGLELWALVLPEWEIVSVRSETNHDTQETGRGRSGVRIAQYLVHDDVATFS